VRQKIADMIIIRKATPDDAGAIIRFQQAMAMETESLELKTETVTRCHGCLS